MESDNSSMDGEVDTHWRESLNKKNNHASEDDQYPVGKGPKSPPESNDLEATSPVSSSSSVQGSPRSQSPSGYTNDTNEQPPRTPGEPVEQNGDHDAEDRLSLSPEPQERETLEARDSRSQSPSNPLDQNPEQDKDHNSSPSHSHTQSPVSSLQTNHRSPTPDEEPNKSSAALDKSLAEDLSDVSDIESLDANDEDILNAEESEEKHGRSKMNGGVSMSLAVTDEEQLDFEEEQEEEATGGNERVERRAREEEEDEEREETKSTTTVKGPNEEEVQKKEAEDGELEEGEVSDEGEARPEESEPRPLCRFFSRGACTWGSSCRFLHPGVTDKGHYTMFLPGPIKLYIAH